jgi:hypothetical protein
MHQTILKNMKRSFTIACLGRQLDLIFARLISLTWLDQYIDLEKVNFVIIIEDQR